MLRFFVGIIFASALGAAGYMIGSKLGGRQQAELMGLGGIFLAVMILVATRIKAL